MDRKTTFGLRNRNGLPDDGVAGGGRDPIAAQQQRHEDFYLHRRKMQTDASMSAAAEQDLKHLPAIGAGK